MGLWIFATFTSYIIKGLCGFANTMVFTAMLSFGSVNANISPVDLLLGYPANAILTWKNRKSLDPKVFIPLSAMVLAGSIPGSFLLKNVNASANSAHVYGTTFDVAYARYKGAEKEETDKLKSVLAEVLQDLRKQKKCYVRYEFKQGCFHITVR